MTADEKFDIRDEFQAAFAKLVAQHLDKCDTPDNASDVLAMLQDCISVYGCGWKKHSTKFKPVTIKI